MRNAIMKALDALEVKAQEWQTLIEDNLPTKLNNERLGLTKLEGYHSELSARQEQLEVSNVRTQLRINARNERPTEECKSDTAEVALVEELRSIEILQAEAREKE